MVPGIPGARAALLLGAVAAAAVAQAAAATSGECHVLVGSASAAELALHPRAIRVQSLHDAVPVLRKVAAAGRAGAGGTEAEEAPALEVCLADGTHLLRGEPWEIPADAPPNVVWRPATPAAAPVVSGGQPLDKWYPCDQDAHCPGWPGVWVHFLANGDVPGRNASSPPVRNLWVNGARVPRKETFGTELGAATATATGYRLAAPAEAQFLNQPLELLWPRVFRNWIEPRCAASLDATGVNVTVDPACWAQLVARKNPPPPPVTVGNVGGPPSEGTFNEDPQYLFYLPPAGSLAAPPSDAWIGGQEALLVADGVTGHSWVNLSFAYSAWDQVDVGGGYVPGQAAVVPGPEPLGAVRVTRGTDLVFTGCHVRHIGGAWGLSVTEASKNVTVSRNTFDDLSGGAVKLGNVNDTRAVSNVSADWDAGFALSDNAMSNAALEYRGAPVVFAGFVKDTTIAHNSIENTSYTGISLGWGWGTVVSFARNNHVVGNRLLNVMQFLNDGGCVYTLGPQPNSTVRNNYCRSDAAPVVGCFYHDNGSRYFNTTGNVADTSPAPCVYLQGCCNLPALDCHVSSLYCRSTAPVRNGCAPQGCTIDEATLFYVDAAAPWPAEAQAVVDASGVTPL